MTVDFRIGGQRFTALNGGPVYRFSPAVSFVVSCADQAEVDKYWDAFADGGTPSQCGWIDDKFGLTWQVVPRALIEMMESEDAAAKGRMTAAMFTMRKLVIADLKAAFEGK
jgi:predicted 3-demethylubiquinone-9 3-methyltransferase (glyoxalase superfamily)